MGTVTSLRDLHGVDEACQNAEEAVRKLRMHPLLFRAHTSPARQEKAARARAEWELRAACASAELDGASWARENSDDVEAVRAGVVTDQRVQGALRCYAELPSLISVWRRAPLQVLARLHVLAAVGTLEPARLGRPEGTTSELVNLADLVITERANSAIVMSAIVHGELLRLTPFGAQSGVVARASARVTCASAGLDPHLDAAVEQIHLERAPEYLGAAKAYATGRTDGVRAWLKHCALAYQLGAERTLAACESL
ncbi:MAG: oxidoreductase [Corynebacteriales bacterium]|nr:oxidoreductase [Mycobacteriales bacterium]